MADEWRECEWCESLRDQMDGWRRQAHRAEADADRLREENSRLRIDNENMYYAMDEAERLREARREIANLESMTDLAPEVARTILNDHA